VNKGNNILKNALSAILLVLITAVVYIFLYKYLIIKVGIDQLGVWSLVIATISVGAIANTALSESVVRFVAIYSVKNDWVNVSKVLMTSCYILAILLSVFLATIYAASYYLLPFVVKNNYLVLARSLLPWGLIGFWLNGVASAFLSFFEGMRLAYIKNLVSAASVFLFYAGSIVMVPRYGLIGVVYAQVLQSGALLVVSAILVFIKLPVFSLRPLGLKSDLFRQIVKFSVNIQVVSIVTILYEPVTKYFLAKYGNISFVGFYEMANRLVSQARSVIISATQILVPNMTIEAEKSLAALNAIYSKVFSIVFSVSTFMLSAIFIFLPYISIFWIGHFEPIFILSTIILGIGWYINIFMSPVYFVNYATNSLNINLKGQIITGVLNPCLCLVLGMFFGSFFVVTGWAIAIAGGAIYILIASHKKYSISNIGLFKPEIKKVLWGLFFAALAWVMYYGLVNRISIYSLMALGLAIFVILTSVAIRIDENVAYMINMVKLKVKQSKAA
jgi:O-antigen/teichoic acid export membrane protein